MGGRKRAALAAGLWVLSLAGATAAQQRTALDLSAAVDAERHQLYAVEYARSDAVASRRLIRGAAGRSVDMSWYFFIVVGYGRVVLVDCGTDAFTRPGRDALRRRWSIRYAVTVEEALGRLGLAHDDVTDVVLTHHHWDHVGALGELTSARVHANVDEWRAVPPRLRRPVESSGRFRPINGPRVTLWPGFLVREAGLHTAHHSMVEIDCENGGVVIVSDAAYLYQSIDEGLSSAVSTDPQQNVRDVADAVLRVERDHVLPGHDPEIFARHPSGAPGVALICR